MKLRNMINLIKNENMKLAHRISTWIMIGILIIITIISGFVYKHSGNNDNTIGKQRWLRTIRTMRVD